MLPRRWLHPDKIAHLMGVVQGFAEILDGIVTVSTLGFYASGFEMWVARERTKGFFKRSKAKKLKQI
jgi:hypothetical protein